MSLTILQRIQASLPTYFFDPELSIDMKLGMNINKSLKAQTRLPLTNGMKSAIV